jgi:predicted DNA-binding protein YlxM (UPF0122 family)
MTNSTSQRSFDARLMAEFKERLLADLPAVERFVTAIREFCSPKPALPTPLPCTACPKSGTPHEPCERLEAHIDGAYRGKLHGETTIGVNFDEVRDRKAAPGQGDGDETVRKIDRGTFRNFRKVEPFDAMESYKPCWHLLSHKQREVVHLHLGEGKRNSEIAVLLDKAPSTVSDLLKRAQKTKEEHDAEMRRQELKLQRELETKSGEI